MIACVSDPHFGPSRCRDCQAPIVWALTEAGRRMPVDVEPVAGGELELYAEFFPDGEAVDPGLQRVRNRPSDRATTSPAWRGHWLTCSARRGPRRIHPVIVELIARARAMKWGPLFAQRGGQS